MVYMTERRSLSQVEVTFTNRCRPGKFSLISAFMMFGEKWQIALSVEAVVGVVAVTTIGLPSTKTFT